MKKFLAGLITGAVLASAVSVGAVEQVRLIVNGREVVSDVPPQIIDGRTMVPAKPLAEALGAKVEWDNATRSVMVTSTVETQAKKVDKMLKVNGQDTGRPAWTDENGQPVIEVPVFFRTVLPVIYPERQFQFHPASGSLTDGQSTWQFPVNVLDDTYTIGLSSVKAANLIQYTWNEAEANLTVSAP